MQQKIAHIFPAFTTKYTGKEISILEKYDSDFSKRLKVASAALNVELIDFDIEHNNFLEDELKNQFLSYTFSCAFSDILKVKGLSPHFISGFSMGLYAALYHADAISFETGLLLIKDVFSTVNELLGDTAYSMMSVIGFHKADLNNYLRQLPDIEIAIENGKYSYVLTGSTEKMNKAYEILEREGAIYINKFQVSSPYHSTLLFANKNKFISIVEKYSYSSFQIPLISMSDQKIINSMPSVKEEIVKNVISPLSFLRTLNLFVKIGITTMIEVGAGDSLLKSSKFIDGNFKFHAISKGKLI